MATKRHTFIARSKRQTSDDHAYQYKQRNDKLYMHVYLVLSVRRSMETYIQTQGDEKQNYPQINLVRRAMETLRNAVRRKKDYTCM